MGALRGRRGALAGELKPLGRKNYGSIGHLPSSRLGPGDHHVHEGQARIACEKARPGDFIIVQEKLDGSNVGIARLEDGSVVALGRAGYLAQTSRHRQHQRFAAWVKERDEMFRSLLDPGQRVVGEWLDVAHGTRYELQHDPFVVLDLMVGSERSLWIDVDDWAEEAELPMPCILSMGSAMPVEAADEALGDHGHHGAIDMAEGAVWRVECEGRVDFLAKWVRPDFIPGRYLGGDEVRNTVCSRVAA